MTFTPVILFVVHLAASVALAAYGYNRLVLGIRYLRHVKRDRRQSRPPPTRWPFVTVQIPLYNERYVAERAIAAAGALAYPKSLLEIQVLDDSTDETSTTVRQVVDRLRRQGIQVEHIQRPERVGFKAGALAYGLRCARGELIAVFDADFVPPSDFLERLVGEFDDPTMGMVPARWGHLNAGASLLTSVQALQLDAHFAIEHGVRAATGCFFNFNGTAGVWRRQAIEEGGGWGADTLTEDLDLSYRTQMAGWKFAYRDDVVAPAELPVEMAAYKVQQQRWAQGGIQTAFKVLPELLRSSLPTHIKREACWHLGGHAVYPFLIAMGVAGIAGGWLGGADYRAWIFAINGALLTFATLSLAFFYGITARTQERPDWARRVALAPIVMVLGAGITLSQSVAVARALLKHPTPFRRTPKYHQSGSGDRRWLAASYRIPALGTAVAECAAGLAVLLSGVLAVTLQVTVPPGPIILFGIGFLATGGGALLQHRRPTSV